MYATYGKRLLDILFCVVCIPIFALPSLLVALLIKLNSFRDPVLFSHTRCGRDNQPFTLYKFRTFTVESSDYMPTRDVKQSSDITSIGKILRKLSLDELPQIWNVLRGDMSIVGPRPVLFKEESLIRRRTENGANQLRPGITGWAQVKGRDLIGPAKKAKLDGEYRERISFLFDVYCLFLTVWTVVAFRGHAEGHSGKHEKIVDEDLRVTNQ